MPNSGRPLRRETVTEGSVLILPVYPASFTLIGLTLLLQDDARSSSPAFLAAKWIMSWTHDPIHTWGFLFLGLALLEWGAMFAQQRTLFMWLLVVGCGYATCWAALLLSSAFIDPFVSFTGAVWVGVVALAHIASVRSLARDVVLK